MNYFFGGNSKGNPFVPFSLEHWIAVFLFLLGCLSLYFFREKLIKKEKTVRWILFGLLLFFELGDNFWMVYNHHWELSHSLPLELCSISVYLCLFLLLTNQYKIFEIVYFTGLGGALQAILTPELYFNFPHYRFIQFFASHSLIIWTCLFFVFVKKYKPTFKSILKTFAFLNILVVFISFINHITGGNYMFLSHKPENPSLIDFLGSYPWYILSLEGVALLLFSILYLPFLFFKKRI